MILHALDPQAHRYSHLLVDRNGNSKPSDFPLSSTERSWVSNILFPMRHNCLSVKTFQHIILTIVIQDCFTPNASTSLLGKHCQLANFWCDYSFCESVLTLCKEVAKTNTEIRAIKCTQNAWISLVSMAYIWLNVHVWMLYYPLVINCQVICTYWEALKSLLPLPKLVQIF